MSLYDHYGDTLDAWFDPRRRIVCARVSKDGKAAMVRVPLETIDQGAPDGVDPKTLLLSDAKLTVDPGVRIVLCNHFYDDPDGVKIAFVYKGKCRVETIRDLDLEELLPGGDTIEIWREKPK